MDSPFNIKLEYLNFIIMYQENMDYAFNIIKINYIMNNHKAIIITNEIIIN